VRCRARGADRGRDGGTLFLDEIGRCRWRCNPSCCVLSSAASCSGWATTDRQGDVRIIAATHRPLAQHTQTGAFRADLYYRLAVFLIRTPSLSEHAEDLPLLVNHLSSDGPRNADQRVDPAALAKLAAHDWPGNVRELEHVLERGAILAGDEAVMTSREIDFGLAIN